jgi:molybdopterin molybdotransferase
VAGRKPARDLGERAALEVVRSYPLPSDARALLLSDDRDVERLLVLDEVPPGKNIGASGEDVAAGATVLSAGRALRPQDVGLLSSIGIAGVEVVRRPRVRIVITSDEVLPAGSPPVGSRIADANGPMLAALVERDGGVASLMPRSQEAGLSDYVVPDDQSAILAAMQVDEDVVLVSGGSSVGQEDHAPLLLARHGELAIHGIAMRPSSPTGMGRLGSKLVFLLPGNPVSCLCAYDFFAGRAIRLLGGRSAAWPYPARQMPLARKLVSQVGRVDYARVRITGGEAEPLAISGASILSSTTIADGFVVVPADSEGYPARAEVEVFLYDRL